MGVSWNGKTHSHSQFNVDNQQSVKNILMDTNTKPCIEMCVGDGLKPIYILRKLWYESFMVPTVGKMAVCIAYIAENKEHLVDSKAQIPHQVDSHLLRVNLPSETFPILTLIW